MKKSKIISIRLSEQEYRLLFNDYIQYKNYPNFYTTYFRIKVFSDYIRLMIQKGLND